MGKPTWQGKRNGKRSRKFSGLFKHLGKSPEDYIIALEKQREGEEGLRVSCTCNEFSVGPSTNLMELGIAAKRHEIKTGHQRRKH